MQCVPFVADDSLVSSVLLLSVVSKWKPGQPDNWTHGHEEGEDCAGLIHDAFWNDFYCTDRIGFICERAAQCEFFFCDLDSSK